jgi:hypothetical protein
MTTHWNSSKNLNRAARIMAKEMKKDRLLRRMGLEERSPTGDVLSGFGLFALGLAVGAGIGLLFAPRPGTEMRNVVGDTWRNRMHRGGREHESDIHLGPESAPSSIVP